MNLSPTSPHATVLSIPVLSRWADLKEHFALLSDSDLQQLLRTKLPNYWLPQNEEDKNIWLIEIDYERLLKVIDANMLLDILVLVLTPEGLHKYPEHAERMLKALNPLAHKIRLFRVLSVETQISPTAILEANGNPQSPFFGKLNNLGNVKEVLEILSNTKQRLRELDQKIERSLGQLSQSFKLDKV